MSEDTDYRKFVQSVIDNIKKNGFPEKKVAFPIEQMYELAEKKGISFNKVLETLDEIQIAHEKTPEKIIFFPKEIEATVSSKESPLLGLNGLDPAMFENMDLSKMMSTASEMMKNMSPEQLDSIKGMYENMSEEQRAELLEKAKKMGLF